jgi:hypothetical protein
VTYSDLVGRLGEAPTVWAECLFFDPIADLAVLGTPDCTELYNEADAYDQLIEQAQPLQIGALSFERPSLRLSDGSTFPGSPFTQLEARLLSLAGHWFSCTVSSAGRSLDIKDAAEPIRNGMSGSPILLPTGDAIGVLCVSATFEDAPNTRGGPNPLLQSNLPGWMLRDKP